MATWAGVTTRHIGKKAQEVFSKEIIEEGVGDADEARGSDDGDGSDSDDGNGIGGGSAVSDPNDDDILRRHAACLVNMMNADDLRRPEELEFYAEFIKQAKLEPSAAERLLKRTDSWRRLPVALEPFKRNGEAAEALRIDLVALAKRDGKVHATEVAYAREVAAEVGISDSQVTAMFEPQTLSGFAGRPSATVASARIEVPCGSDQRLRGATFTVLRSRWRSWARSRGAATLALMMRKERLPARRGRPVALVVPRTRRP